MPKKRDQNPRLLNFARHMRRESTDAEQKLWSLLRRGQIDGHHFRRQVPVARFILDFYCASANLAVEADGAQHGDEAHAIYDREREKVLAARGIRVMRFSDYDILKTPDVVIEAICTALKEPPP